MSAVIIDKIAYIYIKDRKLLVSLSRGKDIWYIPGGKREGDESDVEALVREVKEELSVDVLPETAKLYGIFEAQAHGKPAGTIVRMTCYTADFTGTLNPATEIDRIDFFAYDQRFRSAPVDLLIFEDLKKRNLID